MEKTEQTNKTNSNVRLKVISKSTQSTLATYFVTSNDIVDGGILAPIFNENLYDLINDSAPFSISIRTIAKYTCDNGFKLVLKQKEHEELIKQSEKLKRRIEELQQRQYNLNTELETIKNEIGKSNNTVTNDEILKAEEDITTQISILQHELNEALDKERYEEEIRKEKAHIENILKNINPEKSINTLLKEGLIQGLIYGYTGYEVVFNSLKDRFQLIRIPTHELRITQRDREFTTYKIEDENGNEVEMDWRFRKYVQYQGNLDITDSTKFSTVYFKDINDPRNLNYTTGEYTTETLPDNVEANPCMFLNFGILQDREYPYPIWLGGFNDIMGFYYATKLNKNWFEDGMLVSMAVVVDGVLDEDTYNELTTLLDSAKGIENSAKLIVIENLQKNNSGSTVGLNFNSGMDNKFNVSFEKLPAMDLKDGQFLEYIRQTIKNIRMLFNIPAILLGLEESYNRNTAIMAVEMANQQFQSYRSELENMVNRILKEIGIKYHEFKLNTPNITDYKEVVEMLKPFIENDIIPVKNIHDIFNEIFNTDVKVEGEEDLLISEWKNERITEFDNMNNTEESNENSIEIPENVQNEIGKVLQKHNINYTFFKIK
jgi:capsid portal protein